MEGKYNFEFADRQNGEPDISERQIGYIQALTQKIGIPKFPEDGLTEIGQFQASSLIDQLEAINDGDGSLSLETTVSEGDASGSSNRTAVIVVVVLIVGLILASILT